MEEKTSWDENVFFCGGKAWGVREAGMGDRKELKSVCLGDEDDVKKRLRESGRNSSETPSERREGG